MSAQSSSRPDPASREYRVLYKASGLSPVRMLTICATAFGLAGLLFAYKLLQAPVEGLLSSRTVVVSACVMLVMALGSFFGVWAYGRRIAARISLSPDGKTLRVGQPTPFGMQERDILVSDIQFANIQPGDPAGEESLAESNLRVEVRGQRGFVVPLAGRARDKDTLVKILSGEPTAGNPG